MPEPTRDELARLRDENANLQRENIRINGIIDQQAERFESLETEIERLRTVLANLLEDTQHVEHDCGDADCPVEIARQFLLH